MLAALNDQLQERKLDSQYVTMLMAVWDDRNQTLQIANAGSVQPLFVAADATKPPAVRTINAEGFPLGLFPNAEYEEFTLSTQPGDLIVFFSDGIVDAVNADGEMFGDERLKQLLESQRQPTARSTVDSILQAVTDFQAGTAHFDDETIVVLRALEPPDPSH
jgi:phosphoserine phosphatase RsbU/P